MLKLYEHSSILQSYNCMKHPYDINNSNINDGNYLSDDSNYDCYNTH